MKNNILLILTLLTYHPITAQPRAGFEQYYSPGPTLAMMPVTRVYYATTGKGYVEARYNYDAAETVGLSIGKQFGKEQPKDLDWTLTPTAGVVAGKNQGASLGLNSNLQFHDWSFSNSTQFTPMKKDAYFYSWSELGRSFGRKGYFGAALQQDCRSGASCSLSPGITGRLSIAGWTFPLYIFNPFDKRVWLLMGITREWVLNKGIDHPKNSSPSP